MTIWTDGPQISDWVHFGSGYAGGFLPFISQYTVVKTGNAFAGFWYAISVVMLALFITVALSGV